jgi:hypothetical protein
MTEMAISPYSKIGTTNDTDNLKFFREYDKKQSTANNIVAMLL